MAIRKIIHIDMDAFYASVEQRDFPELRGKPVIVGGQPNSRGVVAACSYEARRFGVHSAMPSSQAARLCPDAIFVKGRFDAYRECSRQLHQIFKTYTQLIEPLSLDEAFLDVTDCEQHSGSATLIARAIKQQIKDELNLIASAGVSFNKFLAKIASDVDKPDGLYVIRPEQADAFICELPIRKFFGVGKVTEQKMLRLGIHRGEDLRRWSEKDLSKHFGKSGRYYHRIARGIDERPVRPNRERKSLGKETTFSSDLTDIDDIRRRLKNIAEKIAALVEERELQARTLTLKVKYQDFTLITRSLTKGTGSGLFSGAEDMIVTLDELIAKTEVGKRPCRLLGLSLSNFASLSNKEEPVVSKSVNLDLWGEEMCQDSSQEPEKQQVALAGE